MFQEKNGGAVKTERPAALFGIEGGLVPHRVSHPQKLQGTVMRKDTVRPNCKSYHDRIGLKPVGR